jgi:hypothetical protein
MAEAGALKALGRVEESKTAAREALQLRPGDEVAREAAGLVTPKKAKISARSSFGNDRAAAEPIPGPLSAEEIERMTRDQAREALVKVSRSRQRSDVTDDVKTRLKIEFDLLVVG